MIRFKAPDVLFDRGKDYIKPRFQAILSDFFPRYVAVLRPFNNTIEELRIEGHTSSIWNVSTTAEQAYFLNMGLSQARTREVLELVLTLPAIIEERGWVQPLLTANGLSSGRLIKAANGVENPSASRRVEFRVELKASSEIV